MSDIAKSTNIIRIDTRNKWFNFILIIACFLFLLFISLDVPHPIAGDESAYLLMSYSLIHDHDLNVSNNIINKDYLSFDPTGGAIQGAPAPGAPTLPRIYELHGNGLPLVISLGFLLSSMSGPGIEMVAIATLVIYLTWVWTKQITKNRKVAYIAAGLLMIAYFFNGLAGFIYPDMLTSAMVLGSLIIAEKYYKQPLFQLLLGFILGFLILVHIKTLDIILPVLALVSYRVWKAEHKLPWLTIIPVVAFVSYYFVSWHHWFGTWGLSSSNGMGGSQLGGNSIASVSAMLFDSYRGLLVYNPIMLLIFLGLPIWFKKNRTSLIIVLLSTIPYLYVVSSFYQWNGGDAPIGRYLIDVLPAFIPAIAFAIEVLTRFWQRAVIFVLGLGTLLITFDETLKKFPMIDPGLIANQARAPLFIQLQAHTGIAFDQFLPRFSQYLFYPTVLIDHHGVEKVIAGYLVIAVVFAYGYYLSRSVVLDKPLIKSHDHR